MEERMLDDNQIIEKAIKLYIKETDNTEILSKTSEVTEMNHIDFVILRNKDGVAAVYEIESDNNLHRLSNIPSGIK